VPLKPCAKCKSSLYCSRECQTGDWKVHKNVCASNAAEGQKRVEEEATSAKALQGSIISAPKPSVEEDDGEEEGEEGSDEEDDEEEWTDEDDTGIPDDVLRELLQRLPKEDTYKIVVNTFQHYKEDYANDHEKSLTTPEELKEHFIIYVNGMKEDGLLPAWWDDKTQEQCEALAEKFGWEATTQETDT
jgi:splicing suppressor protein 51